MTSYNSSINLLVSPNAKENISNGRKNIEKSLITGHQLIISPQEDRMIRQIFEYMCCYHKKYHINILLNKKKNDNIKIDEIDIHNHIVDSQINSQIESKIISKVNSEIDNKLDNQSNEQVDSQLINQTNSKSLLKSESSEISFSNFNLNNEIENLQNKLIDIDKNINNNLYSITFKDIDGITSKLGVKLNKRQIDQMIWEIDENSDNQISWDEFQLTYYRNILDETNCEPNSFFRIMEFLVFDQSNKGYIIEDDCMEVLYARNGKIELDLQSLFGNKLRSLGGDGTLTFKEYLLAMEKKFGKRALILI